MCFIYSGHVKSIIQSCETGQHSGFWGGYQKEINHKKGKEKLVSLGATVPTSFRCLCSSIKFEV